MTSSASSRVCSILRGCSIRARSSPAPGITGRAEFRDFLIAHLFDSHCHLDFPVFDDDRVQVVDEAIATGVRRFFVPGVSAAQWPRLAALVDDHPEVSVGVGLHPYFLDDLTEQQVAGALGSIAEWCERLGAVAVGECGLDALRAKRGGIELQKQASIFERQLGVARQLDLPVVVHVVRAHGLALSILQRCRLPKGGVVHAYSGSVELVREYAELGFYFGFGGALTRDRAERARKALSVVPLERLLLETDAPDQAPAGFVSRNEPRALLQIAEEAGELLEMDLSDLARVTSANAERLFGPIRKNRDVARRLP